MTTIVRRTFVCCDVSSKRNTKVASSFVVDVFRSTTNHEEFIENGDYSQKGWKKSMPSSSPSRPSSSMMVIGGSLCRCPFVRSQQVLAQPQHHQQQPLLNHISFPYDHTNRERRSVITINRRYYTTTSFSNALLCKKQAAACASSSSSSSNTTAAVTETIQQEPKSKKASEMSNKKVTAPFLASKKRHGQKITMVTAYDYPSALHVDRAGIDVLLVGDSCAMVELGYETTQPVTMDEMIHHCKAVHRGANRALLVGDMPLGSYEVDDSEALKNAYRFIKEAGMDAIKMEGGSIKRAETLKKIVEGGVAVMGHVGLLPQAISVLGGFRAQGRTAIRAREILDEAIRLQEAGAFAIVLECVPAPVAKAVEETLEIPTIGIGAGPYTTGQVLVYHDMLGMTSHPHHSHFVPKFCKKYARVGDAITKGLEEFKHDVLEGNFPSTEFSPYAMTPKEEALFLKYLERDSLERNRLHEEAAERLKNADEYEALDLYGYNNNNGGGSNGK